MFIPCGIVILRSITDVYRACLLSEAARLYCLHDQPDMASHLYREAANVMVDSVSLDDSAVGEISAQRFALMADINDQGLVHFPCVCKFMLST